MDCVSGRSGSGGAEFRDVARASRLGPQTPRAIAGQQVESAAAFVSNPGGRRSDARRHC